MDEDLEQDKTYWIGVDVGRKDRTTVVTVERRNGRFNVLSREEAEAVLDEINASDTTCR